MLPVDLHCRFLRDLDRRKLNSGYLTGINLKISLIYWSIGSFQLLRRYPPCGAKTPSDSISAGDYPPIECVPTANIIARDIDYVNYSEKAVLDYLDECWDGAGWGLGPLQCAHITSTMYALYVLAMINRLDHAPKESIVSWITSLQLPNGAFRGDDWGEADGRFSFCATAILSLLNSLDRIDRDKTMSFVLDCMNSDGGFGPVPHAESHAAYAYCSIGTLALLDGLDTVNRDALASWLSRRQIGGSCGGMNGRPEKAPDVCYSFWVFATLKIINRQDTIDTVGLKNFILDSQDMDEGGIPDRKGNSPDAFHTFFGLAALSLLGHEQLEPVDPIWALPVSTIKLGKQ